MKYIKEKTTYDENKNQIIHKTVEIGKKIFEESDKQHPIFSKTKEYDILEIWYSEKKPLKRIYFKNGIDESDDNFENFFRRKLGFKNKKITKYLNSIFYNCSLDVYFDDSYEIIKLINKNNRFKLYINGKWIIEISKLISDYTKIDKQMTASLILNTISNENLIKNTINQDLLAKKTINCINYICPEQLNNARTKDFSKAVQLLFEKFKDIPIDITTKEFVDANYLKQLILEVKKNIDNNVLEKKWQKLFEKNFTIFDSRYRNVKSNINITSIEGKKPDLILFDFYNNVDILELKTTKTKILKHEPKRNIYYWHEDMAEAIAQVKYYMFKIESERSTLKTQFEDLGYNANISKTRAYLFVGTSSQLKDNRQKLFFELLRRSEPNITIMLYDELLSSLKNKLNPMN